MFRTCIAAAIILALAACSAQNTETGSTSTATPAQTGETAHVNPLFSASSLPLQAPPFDKLTDTHYQAAIEEGMRQHLVEVRAIAANSEPATFANTIEPLERSGALLTRASLVFFALAQANTNETLQKAQVELAPKLAMHGDEIHLDAQLFARIQAIHAARDSANLDAEQKRLVEHYQRNFVRAGAQLPAAEQARLRELNVEVSSLETDFEQRLLAASNAGAMIVEDVERLDGMSPGDIAAAADAASERKLAGKWVLALQNTTQQPVLASLRNRALRGEVLQASQTRASHGDANDTRPIAGQLARLRAERARLLGFPTFAAYALDDQMARTPDAARTLLTDMVPAATAKARGEAARIQKLIDEQKGGFALTAADWDFYASQVRKAEYDLDDSEVAPYFELDRVLKDGVFFAATELYGITFKERSDLPVYHPDVRVFDVLDKDGKVLALFYSDNFSRPSKAGGAWMSVFVEQSHLLGTRPVVFNVCNFTKPAEGQPALLSWDDVTTLFHEFGHALHGFFSDATWPSLAGTNVPRDFVEFPSQFNEHWALEPRVFANYAKHHETGAPMPQALVDKIVKARTFNQGYATTEYLAAALLDMAWHTLPADAPMQDADAFEREALTRFNVDLAEVPPRYRTPYFAHIWGGGYASGYYAYLWSEVLAHDTYQWFVENGGFTRANGDTFRARILSRGATEEFAPQYRAFRGRDPSVEPLLEHRGLK